MVIHNLAEDLVLSMVGEAFTEKNELETGRFCMCYQCRLDVACYVLNRILPEYVISGRGVVHRESAYLDNIQRRADIMALITEGMKKIDSLPRPHFMHKNEQEVPIPPGDYFNFPFIIGRIFDSATFEPLTDASVTLLQEGVPVHMIGPNWQNPYVISSSTPGLYTFFPKPLPAPQADIDRSFEFDLSITKAGFDPLDHHFMIPIVSEDRFIEFTSGRRNHKVNDLYLFSVCRTGL